MAEEAETETLIQSTPEEASPERPEWLPEKFNNPSE